MVHLSASSDSGLQCIFSAWLCTAPTLTNNYILSGKARYKEYLEEKMEGKIQKRRQRGDLKDFSHILLFPVLLLSLLSFFSVSILKMMNGTVVGGY